MPHAPSYNDPTMILIDAYSQIFRGYYAVSGLTSSRGEPTNAVFAIAKLLLKMHREYPGSSGAAVFDCGKVAYRMELNPAYKANRKPTPPELLAQLPAIRELFAAFGWPLLEKEQYEADDLIAALAVANTAHPVKIVSSDKDLSQIICDRITQLVPDRKSGFQERGCAEVEMKFQVPAARIVDYLALLGDAADNIPGAPGIGEKTAARLLNEYGPLEPLLAAPEMITDLKLRAKLEPAAEILKRNIRLITLNTTLPGEFLPLESSCRRQPPDWEAVRRICDRLDLHAIRKEVDAAEKSFRKHDRQNAAPVAVSPEDDLFSFVASTPCPPASGETTPPAPQMVQDDLFGNF